MKPVKKCKMKVKYPDITVNLTGIDGNAFSVMGAVSKALRRNGVSSSEIQKFMDECNSGDYDHLLQTCMAWVETN